MSLHLGKISCGWREKSMFRFPPKHRESRGVRQVRGSGCSIVDFCLCLGNCCCRRSVCVGGRGAMAAGTWTRTPAQVLLRSQWLGCTLVPGLHTHNVFVAGAGWFKAGVGVFPVTTTLPSCCSADKPLSVHMHTLHSYPGRAWIHPPLPAASALWFC